LALDVARFLKSLSEGIYECLVLFWRCTIKETDHRNARLLGTRRERPRDRRTAEQRDELASFHSITSSARASSIGGISRPSAWAVLRLMTSSTFVTCWTGRSAGFSPLRIRPV
jgi:hypothetical protein